MLRVACLALLGLAQAKELTKETWDDAVSGKTVFVKFLVRTLQEDEARLGQADERVRSSDVLIADVDADCTAGGKSKCEEVGVRGYPTIKYGDPDDLQVTNAFEDPLPSRVGIKANFVIRSPSKLRAYVMNGYALSGLFNTEEHEPREDPKQRKEVSAPQDYKGSRKALDPSVGQPTRHQLHTMDPYTQIQDLCDADKKKLLEEYMAMDSSKRETMIKEKEAEIEKLESDFKTFVEGLQKQYSEASDKKDKDVEAIKSSGLGLLKSVHSYRFRVASVFADLLDDPEGSQGFCLLNNVAIGAAYARCVYRHLIHKVAIIDFDVHHGNGTEAIVKNMRPRQNVPPEKSAAYFHAGHLMRITHTPAPSCKPWLDPDADVENVFFASIHGFGAGFYPGSGRTAESTKPRIINVGLRKNSGPVEFRKGMRYRILPALQEFSPDLIFISAGFDGHEDDLIGCCSLSEEDYVWATQQLMAVANRCCQGRLISVLEGGYNTRAEALSPFAAAVTAHVRTLMFTSQNYNFLDYEAELAPGDERTQAEVTESLRFQRREEAKRLRRKRARGFPGGRRRAKKVEKAEEKAVEDQGAPDSSAVPSPPEVKVHWLGLMEDAAEAKLISEELRLECEIRSLEMEISLMDMKRQIEVQEEHLQDWQQMLAKSKAGRLECEKLQGAQEELAQLRAKCAAIEAKRPPRMPSPTRAIREEEGFLEEDARKEVDVPETAGKEAKEAVPEPPPLPPLQLLPEVKALALVDTLSSRQTHLEVYEFAWFWLSRIFVEGCDGSDMRAPDMFGEDGFTDAGRASAGVEESLTPAEGMLETAELGAPASDAPEPAEAPEAGEMEAEEEATEEPADPPLETAEEPVLPMELERETQAEDLPPAEDQQREQPAGEGDEEAVLQLFWVDTKAQLDDAERLVQGEESDYLADAVP
ncbi:Type-2 histone deacetylase 2 [Symbiodinium microadriaticum]|uniref:Type-2 histone deacetylase 2 n=1 Tax=Symbiodinium microadriaticum TaxID=2951 RepID=A0A1Q9E8L4_SYMMI|nr:Type-2 histone deacetylase 2 [Symbiodinium microadriaticum]